MRQINLDVLLKDHACIWHPRVERRAKARAELRRLLPDLHIRDFENLIEHVKIPCLMHLEAVFSDIIEGFYAQAMLESYDETVVKLARAVEDLNWTINDLGKDEVVLFDSARLRQSATAKSQRGTLLAFGC